MIRVSAYKNNKITRYILLSISLLFLFTSCKSNNINYPDNLSEEEKIIAIIESMSIEEKVGQLLIGRCPIKNPEKDIEKYHLGGLTFYLLNFNHEDKSWLSKQELKQLLDLCQSKSKIPIFFAVDEEGGSVTRLSENPDFFPDGKSLSPRQIYEKEGLEGLRKDSLNKSKILKELGLHVNFAPVADVVTDENAFMFNRSLSSDPLVVSSGVKTMVQAMNEVGIGSVLKHFPGYGNDEDTHDGIVWDDRKYEEYENVHYLPFIEGIDAGCKAIMIKHSRVKSIDPTRPASISPLVIKELRDKLNFDGLIITDDIAMSEMEEADTDGRIAVEAFLAGNDMIISSNYKYSYEALLKAVENKEISIERLDESLKNIIKYKICLGIIE